jgi:hypothetical protein
MRLGAARALESAPRHHDSISEEAMSSPVSAPIILPRMADADGPAEVGRLAAAWPAVAVRAIDVHPIHDGDDSRASVQACVQLGGLLPVDVRVALVASPRRSDARARRMLSVHAYGNGSFLFETSVPVAQLADDWSVEVRPPDWLAPSVDVVPVARWFAAPPAGIGVLPSGGHTLRRAVR